MTSAPAIGFDYAPSRWLRRVLLLVAALAVVVVMSCSLPLWIRLTLVVVAGWGSGPDWTLHMADNEDVAAALLSFRVLGPFVLLRLRAADRGVHALLLAPDNSDADIRRRLRMRLATVTPGEALPRL